MKGKNFNKPGHKPVILLAPLDWGLGHATRSIPVIKGLLLHGCEVIIAAGGQGGSLLENEFPKLRFLHLRGYHIHYSRKGSLMPLILLLQFPKILFSIYHEYAWLKKVIKKYAVDAVISDSRPGMHHSSVPCIYMVHQLIIKTGNHFTEWLLQKFHYRFINKFHECWVPDAAGEFNLAGELSHPVLLPKVPVKYIGPLSRFERSVEVKKYDLLVILSGPEPQRTVFEKILLNDLQTFSGKVLLVRGLPSNSTVSLQSAPSLEIQNHLPTMELNRAILQSELIISRCGYSTVMDLVKLKKKAILVPTPGQTEQEHLAGYLLRQNLFFCTSQDLFSLSGAIKQASSFTFSNPFFPANDHEKAIGNFVQSLV